MARLLISLIVWSAVVVIAITLWPANVNTPGCIRAVAPTAACLDELTAYNNHLWWTDTLPRLAVLGGGYVVIAAPVIRRWARAR